MDKKNKIKGYTSVNIGFDTQERLQEIAFRTRKTQKQLIAGWSISALKELKKQERYAEKREEVKRRVVSNGGKQYG